MSPEPTFGAVLAGKLAVDFTKDLISAVAGKVRRQFKAPELEAALRECVQSALEKAIQSVSVPESLQDFGDEGRGHLYDLLRDFLRSEEVCFEIANLIDPRPDTELDFAAVVKSLEDQGFEYVHFPDFDLASFLSAFAREFYAAAARRAELQGVLQLHLLAELASATVRSVQATESLQTGRMARQLEELNSNVRQVLEGGSEQPLLKVIQVFLSEGSSQAYLGYEALTAALNQQGYALSLYPPGQRLEIIGHTLADDRALTASRLDALQGAAAQLRDAILESQLQDQELDELETRYRQHLVRWFENLTFQGMMRSPGCSHGSSARSDSVPKL